MTSSPQHPQSSKWEEVFDCFDLGVCKWQVKDFIRDLLHSQRTNLLDEIRNKLPPKNERVGDTCVGRCSCFQSGENNMLNILLKLTYDPLTK